MDYLGVSGYIGTEGLALKSASGWFFGGNAIDDYGFAALYRGWRFHTAEFSYLESDCVWWSSSGNQSSTFGYLMIIGKGNDSVYITAFKKTYGFSVRCLID